MKNFTRELTVKLIVVSIIVAAVFITVASIVILSVSKDTVKTKMLGTVIRMEANVLQLLREGRSEELDQLLLREAVRSPYNLWVADAAGTDLRSPDPVTRTQRFRDHFPGLPLHLQWANPRPVGGAEMRPEVKVADIAGSGFKEGFGTYRPAEDERVVAFRLLQDADGKKWILGADEPVALASSQYATVKTYILFNSLLIALLILSSTAVTVKWVIKPYYRRVEEINIHLEEMNSRLENANRQMERYTLNLTKLYEITKGIFQSLKLKERLQGILDGAQEVMGIDRIVIMLPDDKRSQLSIVASLGDYAEPVEEIVVPLNNQAGMIYEGFSSGEILTVDRPEERESLELAVPFSGMDALTAVPCAIIPLRVKDQSVGIIKVDNKFSGRPLNDEDLKLLEIYAGQAAAAVENARLYEQLKGLIDELDRKVDELSIIQQISNTMQSMIREEQLLPFILRGLQESLRFDRIALFLREEGRGLVGKVGIGVQEDALRELVLDPVTSPCLVTTVASKRKAMVVQASGKEDVITVASRIPADGLTVIAPKEMGLTSANVVVAVPMLTKEEVLGVVVADRYVSGEPVTMEHMKSFNTFANTAGLAVERARLYQRLQSTIEELKVTDHLTGLFTHLHFHELMDRVVSVARQERKPLSVVLVRIDNFRVYNRIGGVYLGDKVLKTLATIAKDTIPKDGIAARYAGGAISIALLGLDPKGALAVTDSIRQLFQEYPFEKEKATPRGLLTVSGGVTALREGDRDADDLLSRAEEALCAGEEGGGNKVVLDPTLR